MFLPPCLAATCTLAVQNNRGVEMALSVQHPSGCYARSVMCVVFVGAAGLPFPSHTLFLTFLFFPSLFSTFPYHYSSHFHPSHSLFFSSFIYPSSSTRFFSSFLLFLYPFICLSPIFLLSIPISFLCTSYFYLPPFLSVTSSSSASFIFPLPSPLLLSLVLLFFFSSFLSIPVLALLPHPVLFLPFIFLFRILSLLAHFPLSSSSSFTSSSHHLPFVSSSSPFSSSSSPSLPLAGFAFASPSPLLPFHFFILIRSSPSHLFLLPLPF